MTDEQDKKPPPSDKDAKTDPQALGNIARVFVDEVTGVHVLNALEYQRQNPGTRIGDALVATDAIDAQTRDALVEKQRDLRAGKHSRADLQKMLDYATKKTRSVSDAAAHWLENRRKR